jgi:hypothetical protein
VQRQQLQLFPQQLSPVAVLKNGGVEFSLQMDEFTQHHITVQTSQQWNQKNQVQHLNSTPASPASETSSETMPKQVLKHVHPSKKISMRR